MRLQSRSRVYRRVSIVRIDLFLTRFRLTDDHCHFDQIGCTNLQPHVLSIKSEDGILIAGMHQTHSSFCHGQNKAPPPFITYSPGRFSALSAWDVLYSSEHHSPVNKPYNPNSLAFHFPNDWKLNPNHLPKASRDSNESPQIKSVLLFALQAYSHSISVGNRQPIIVHILRHASRPNDDGENSFEYEGRTISDDKFVHVRHKTGVRLIKNGSTLQVLTGRNSSSVNGGGSLINLAQFSCPLVNPMPNSPPGIKPNLT